MAYEAEKDKILKEENINNGQYKVQLCQYAGGEIKVAILKEISIQGKNVYTSKFGRLDIETARKIAKVIENITE